MIRTFVLSKALYIEEGKAAALRRGLLAYQSASAVVLPEVEIACGPYGKPYFPQHPQIHFNISHAGDLAILTFSEKEVGCDIESADRKPGRFKQQADFGAAQKSLEEEPQSGYVTAERMAKRFFAPQEYEYLLTKPEGAPRQQEFLRLWTRKESCVKAIGRGLGMGIDTFTVLPDKEIVANDRHWYMKEYRYGRYYIAVCGAENTFAPAPERLPDFSPVQEPHTERT